MENQMGEYYLYVEETPGELHQYVREFTNQEELRQFHKMRIRQDQNRVGKGYRMKPANTPKEIML